MSKKVGLIVNPLAGLGGRVGLKGSDGSQIVAQALALGGQPEAGQRAALALAQLAELEPLPQFYAYSGAMGGDILQELGFPCTAIGRPAGETSVAADTIAAAQTLAKLGVDLLIFVGGDGTARNICEAVGDSLPALGVPAGVKIHSAVYAVNPINAGLAARDYLSGALSGLKQAAVMDIDEELFRAGQVQARQYGYLSIPDDSARMQQGKAGRSGEEDELQGMAEFAAEQMEPGTLYIIGPGSTTKAIMDELGLPDTLLGVDAVLDKQLLGADLNERALLELVEQYPQVKIIVTIIGGQGNLFGRGNQQLSPALLRKVGRSNIVIVSGPDKLAALQGRPLRVDSGDAELDRQLSGYMEAMTGYGQYTMVRVEC